MFVCVCICAPERKKKNENKTHSIMKYILFFKVQQASYYQQYLITFSNLSVMEEGKKRKQTVGPQISPAEWTLIRKFWIIVPPSLYYLWTSEQKDYKWIEWLMNHIVFHLTNSKDSHWFIHLLSPSLWCSYTLLLQPTKTNG